MTRFKLCPYKVKAIKNEGSNSGNIDLNTIKVGSLTGFFSFFNYFCKHYNSDDDVFDEYRDQKTFRFSEYKIDNKKNLIYGTIKLGNYGIDADSLDRNTKEKKLSFRKENDSEEFPLFFLFYLPKSNGDYGYLILEKFKQFGSKKILHGALNKSFSENNKMLHININAIIDNKLINEFLKSEKLMEIRFIKTQIPKDVADRHLIKNYKVVYEEDIFKVRRNNELKLTVTEKFEEKFKNINYGYTEIDSEKYDKIKFVFLDKDRRHTVYLNKNSKFMESKSLFPKEKELDKTFPTTDYLYKESITYLNHILKTDKLQEVPE